MSRSTRGPLFALPNEPMPEALYILLGSEQTVKMGTCEHCVLIEQGRPARAWNAAGDNALDFDRDLLLEYLAELGIQIVERQAYVCP